jgi:hypothetical protein
VFCEKRGFVTCVCLVHLEELLDVILKNVIRGFFLI